MKILFPVYDLYGHAYHEGHDIYSFGRHFLGPQYIYRSMLSNRENEFFKRTFQKVS